MKKHVRIAYEVLSILNVFFYYYHHLQILKHVQYNQNYIAFLVIFLLHNVHLMINRYQYLNWTFSVCLLSNLKLFVLCLTLIYLAARNFLINYFCLNKAINTSYSCWNNCLKCWERLLTISKFESFSHLAQFNFI